MVGVSRTALPTRPKSFSPYSSSSWRICALTADCERNTLRPAREKLRILETAQSLRDLSLPGLRLEKLRGDRKGQYSIRVNAQYRLCFRWKDDGAHDVELTDYH